MTNEVTRLRDDLDLAAKTLRRYEALHRAKNTPESLEKAEVNAELATRFEETLAVAGIPATGEAMPDTEQPCYCGPGISLQSVSGGAHETGLFGTVWLRIDDESVEYVRKVVRPAVMAGGPKTPWPLGMGLEPEKLAQAEARIRESVALHQFGQAAEKELGHD